MTVLPIPNIPADFKKFCKTNTGDVHDIIFDGDYVHVLNHAGAQRESVNLQQDKRIIAWRATAPIAAMLSTLGRSGTLFDRIEQAALKRMCSPLAAVRRGGGVDADAKEVDEPD